MTTENQPTTELVILEKAKTINTVELFKPEPMKQLLAEIEKEATSIVFDMTTEKGRKELNSYAFKIAKTKTALEAVGKGLTDDWAKKTKAINAVRNEAWEFLEALQKKIRKPLDEFEAREKTRIEIRQKRIVEIENYTNFGANGGFVSSSIQAAIDAVKTLLEDETFDWQEFKTKAENVAKEVTTILQLRFDERKKAEDDAAELEALRKEKEERDAAEAKRIEEEKAITLKRKNQMIEIGLFQDVTSGDFELEKDSPIRIVTSQFLAKSSDEEWAAIIKTTAEKIVAAKAKKEEEAKKKIEEEKRVAVEEAKKKAEEKAEADKKKLEKENKEKEKKARINQLQSLGLVYNMADLRFELQEIFVTLELLENTDETTWEATIKKLVPAIDAVKIEIAKKIAQKEADDKKAIEDEEQRKREANQKHCKKINGEILESLTKSLEAKDEDSIQLLKEAIILISKGEVPHVSIKY